MCPVQEDTDDKTIPITGGGGDGERVVLSGGRENYRRRGNPASKTAAQREASTPTFTGNTHVSKHVKLHIWE